MTRFVLVFRDSKYVIDTDDGYHYQHPETIVRDVYVRDYCEETLRPKYAKQYKTRAAAERFKKKLMSFTADPSKSEYAKCEVCEVEI